VLTTIVALVAGIFTRRQDSLEAELSKLEGTWDAVAVEGFDFAGESFDFEDSRFKLIRPGIFEVKLANNDVVYGVYRIDGNLLYYTESHPWCVCPTNVDDLLPAVSWNAPASAQHLYTEERRVNRYLLRFHVEDDEDNSTGTNLQLTPPSVEHDFRKAL